MGAKLVPGVNDLLTKRPDLAAQAYGWDPSSVSYASNKRLNWICSAGHMWDTPPNQRVRRNDGCPYCSNRRILPGFNDIQTTHPELSKEAYGWDPSAYGPGSNKKLQWRCSSGHVWYSTPNARTGRKAGCPYCSGRLAIEGVNDLKTLMPALASQALGWDPSKFKPGSSGQSMKWQCDKGHVFFSKICDRALGGNGCPDCAEYGYKQSMPAWIYLLQKEGQQKIGITNSWRTRFYVHRKNGWTVKQKIGIVGGDYAFTIEKVIRRWLKKLGCLVPGTYECWYTDQLRVDSILDLATRAGLDGFALEQLVWLSPDGHTITPEGEAPMANKPPITAAIDLTPDTLNSLKQAGPNERGNYCLDVAVWENTRRSSDRAPGYTGTVKVKGQKDSPKSYASVWDNREGGDDLF